MNTPNKPLVSVIMGSKSDWSNVMEHAAAALDELGIPYEAHAMSAHRTPDLAAEHAKNARDRGIEVIIAGAGCAAHLAGVVAAHTPLPVIGVPVSSPDLKGLDSLLSTVQMPGGIPVATVAIGKAGAKNAGLLAGAILALKYPEIATNYDAFRAAQTAKGEANTDPRS
ncbi:5-(carboxyamino)imidazole ribonucleotide mutase [bacterium]|nr:MAG: 5-(carboxyamino)imidazole ribonucleotide mutase [bacterium]